MDEAVKIISAVAAAGTQAEEGWGGAAAPAAEAFGRMFAFTRKDRGILTNSVLPFFKMTCRGKMTLWTQTDNTTGEICKTYKYNNRLCVIDYKRL